MSRLDENALLIVVSDHGQLASPRPQVWFKLDRLLASLGLLEFVPSEEGGDDEIDFARTTAYSANRNVWVPTMSINLNMQGREPQGVVDPREADRVAQRIVEQLEAISFEDGTPLFGAVRARGFSGSADGMDGVDITVRHTRATKSIDEADRTILVDGTPRDLREYLGWDEHLTGGHDRQGVIFMHGPGVASGFMGQRATPTAVQEIVRALTDKVDAVDSLLPGLRSLGLIEQASTLDITPTVLAALGLPVAEDMDGRPLLDSLPTVPSPVVIATYETGDGRDVDQAGAEPSESDEELMERLRTLGYIE
jgi:predicted AlkP superfamily phosphohydrolase/phosphomutase